MDQGLGINSFILLIFVFKLILKIFLTKYVCYKEYKPFFCY